MLFLRGRRRQLNALLFGLLGVAALLLCARAAAAGSCCGGTAGPSPVLPKLFKGRFDLSFDWEKYDGYWNDEFDFREDPSDSDLNQYRLNFGYVGRITLNWQAYLTAAYVWNDNRYAGVSSGGSGPGDATLGVWWEAPRGWLYLGPSLLIPTGKSPYDNVDSSFDVTGRGFYRLDANALIEKTFSAWDVSFFLAYGWHFERDVNREFGKYVEPYEKRLGDRFSGSAALSYTLETSWGRWTGTGSVAYLKEKQASIDGNADPTSGFQKFSGGGAVAYSTRNRIWTVRAGWSHAFTGQNFPKTDVYSLGVRYAYQ